MNNFNRSRLHSNKPADQRQFVNVFEKSRQTISTKRKISNQSKYGRRYKSDAFKNESPLFFILSNSGFGRRRTRERYSIEK